MSPLDYVPDRGLFDLLQESHLETIILEYLLRDVLYCSVWFSWGIWSLSLFSNFCKSM